MAHRAAGSVKDSLSGGARLGRRAGCFLRGAARVAVRVDQLSASEAELKPERRARPLPCSGR